MSNAGEKENVEEASKDESLIVDTVSQTVDEVVERVTKSEKFFQQLDVTIADPSTSPLVVNARTKPSRIPRRLAHRRLPFRPRQKHDFSNVDILDSLMSEINTEKVRSALLEGSEKSEHLREKELLLKWLEEHNENLYPTREEKLMISAEWGINVQRVNAIFANRRRKVTHDRRKQAGMSPNVFSPQISDMSGGHDEYGYENPRNSTPLTNQFLIELPEPMDVSEPVDYNHQAYAAQNGESNSVEGNSSPYLEYEDNSGLLNDPFYRLTMHLSLMEQQAVLTQILLNYQTIKTQIENGYALNLDTTTQQIQLALIQNSMQNGILKNQILEIQQQMAIEAQQQFAGNSLSASPIVNSDSESSDQIEQISPCFDHNLYNQMTIGQYINQRMGLLQHPAEVSYSPMFKDPHNIADQETSHLLEQTDKLSKMQNLSDDEKNAIEMLVVLSKKPIVF